MGALNALISRITMQGIQEALQKDDMQKAQDLVASLRYVTNIQAAILE